MASLGDLIVTVGAQISGFTDAMTSVSDQLGALGDTAASALDHFDGIIAGFGEVAAAAGIATGAFEIMKGAIEDFSKSEDVQTSFALLAGGAGQAQAAFEGLQATATTLAVPFESLISVAQRLAPQFGVGTAALQAVLTAAADAAAATGNSFDTISQGLDRIAISGSVTTRQLVQMGVSMQDVANFMGVSVAEATALLKKGGQDAQADVDDVVGAIEAKFGGAAGLIAQNLSGQFTNLKNQLAFISEDLGAALAPLAQDLIAGLVDIEPALRAIVTDGVVPLVAGIQELLGWIEDVGGAIKAALGPEVSSGLIAIGGELSTLGGQVKDLAANIVAIGAQTGLTALLQAADAAVAHFGGSLITLKGAFDSLFPEFGQMTDLLTSVNYFLDAYQGKIMGMTGPSDALSNSTRGLSNAWADAGMAAAVTQSVYDKAPGYFGAAKNSVDALTAAFAALGVKIPPSEAELNKLANALETIQAAYEAGQIPISEYDAAVTDFAKKMNSLQGGFVAATGPVDDLGEALKLAGVASTANDFQKLTEAVAATGAGYDLGRVSASDYAAAIDKLSAFTLKNATDGLAGLQAQLTITEEQFALGKVGGEEMAAALDKLIQATPAVQDGFIKQAAAIAGLNVSMLSVTQTAPNVAQILQSFGQETADDVAAHVKHLQDAVDSANAAMEVGVPGAAIAAQLALQALRQEQEKLSSEKLDDTILGIPSLTDLQNKLADVTKAYQDLNQNGLLNSTTSLFW